MSGLISDGLKRFKTIMATAVGAALVGFWHGGDGAVVRTAQEKMRDTINVRDFGADITGAGNSLDAFNKAISRVALFGGGEVVAVGKFKISGGSILVPSCVHLNLRGATIDGDGKGTNTLIKSGAMVGFDLIDITVEYGTGTTGSGVHYVRDASITGGTLGNAGCGVMVHRFNWGCTIEHMFLGETLTNSYMSMQSWGLKVHQNTIFAPAIMKDFVDWTEVTGNSFEGPGSGTSSVAALTITTGGYGGSYSAKIDGNGFHHWASCIAITAETTNLRINGNHFEDSKFHVSGNGLNQYNIDISGNWMKANLAAPGSVVPIVLLNSKNGKIGPNYFSKNGASTFDAYVVMETSDCFGNTVAIDYQPSGNADLTMYRLSEGNLTVQRGGSNNAYLSQPSEEYMSGVGAFTFEKYKRRYNLVANTIPFCGVSYVGNTVTIDTWIPVDAYGLKSRVAFNFLLNGGVSYLVAGDLIGFTFISKVSFDRFTPANAGPAVVASAANGVLRLTLTGVSPGGNIAGWVKQV